MVISDVRSWTSGSLKRRSWHRRCLPEWKMSEDDRLFFSCRLTTQEVIREQRAGKYGAEDDRMESVNQRGPWWPERTAGLPELMARWREHRYLSHYHSRWWTQASLQTPHPWQMKNSPFVNGALRESSGWVRVRFGFESWCFSASMAVLTGGRSKVAIILFRDSSPSLHCCRMQQRSCMPTHPD